MALIGGLLGEGSGKKSATSEMLDKSEEALLSKGVVGAKKPNSDDLIGLSSWNTWLFIF